MSCSIFAVTQGEGGSTLVVPFDEDFDGAVRPSTLEFQSNDFPLNTTIDAKKSIISMFSSLLWPRNELSPQEVIETARFFINIAQTSDKPKIQAQASDNVYSVLFGMKRSQRKALLSSTSTEDQQLCNDMVFILNDLGQLLGLSGESKRARLCFAQAKKWGVAATPPKAQPNLENKTRKDISYLPTDIFPLDRVERFTKIELPKPDASFTTTPQLVYCLELLSKIQSCSGNAAMIDETLDDNERDWIHTMAQDPDEQERLHSIESKLIAEFIDDDLKEATTVTEIVCLGPVLKQPHYRKLLGTFIDGIDQSTFLEFGLLNGLALLIQSARGNYLRQDDLVSILRVLSTRLQRTHQQSSEDLYQLVKTVSYVLDAMADSNVKGLSREQIHEPLCAYLDGLKDNSDPYLVYHAAYAYQALQYVPDDESPLQAVLRRAGAVATGISGLVSAFKSLDLNQFIDGLDQIQEGFAGAFQIAKAGYEGVVALVDLAEKGMGVLDSLKEGFNFNNKRAWYPALRGSSTYIRNGELSKFKRLVSEAPCRRDPAFLMGICERLGDVAADTTFDLHTRQQAVDFLAELYKNDTDWGSEVMLKKWIFTILKRLSEVPHREIQEHVLALEQDLQKDGDADKQALYQTFSTEPCRLFPFDIGLPPLAHSSLLIRAQDIPDVENDLRKLKRMRLMDRGKVVYIPPQAKANLQASDKTLFKLMENVMDFLKSEQRAYLLLGDSGSGKSTFNRELECELWNACNKHEDPIPLHIHLPSIERPEYDLVAKHLRRNDFTEPQIRELRATRRFVLICDGYDECQQVYNLYTSNKLNETGQWQVKMITSCRSEHLGQDYKDRFQPLDHGMGASSTTTNQLQEAVIAPFSKEQIHSYIYRYVALAKPTWRAKSYLEALERVPNLMDLIKNPFLLTLSLSVLPRVVDVDKIQDLSDAKITRVGLYDRFVEHWLERAKKRVGSKDLTQQARSAFETLVDEGFIENGIDYLKRLSKAIYKEQGGHPIVEYSRFKDERTWKSEFFSRDDENRLLREACPLARNGNQHRFIHRSLLEYCFSRAVFDPQESKVARPSTGRSRRGSVSSIFSFDERMEQEDTELTPEEKISSSPLLWRNFVENPSIIQFLAERAQQEPVFKAQLLLMIEQSKVDKTVRTGATNAITIFIQSGVQFNWADLRGIQIPGADLSGGIFEHAQLQGADLRRVSFRNVCLRQADLSGSNMQDARFGEWPYRRAQAAVTSCSYSPDGKNCAVGLKDGTISVFETLTWDQVRTISGHTETVQGVAYSSNGLQIASCSGDKTVRIWNALTGACEHILSGHASYVNRVAFSPSGHQIASAGDDRTVRLWCSQTGAPGLVLTGHTGTVRDVVYSPSGGQIVSCSTDKTLRIWDAVTGTPGLILCGHTKGVLSLAYSPDGHKIVSGSSDETVRIWDAQTGAPGPVLRGHTSYVRCVAYSPSGQQIASGSEDSMVRLWDGQTGVAGPTLRGHTDYIGTVAYSPSGHQIASGGWDNAIRLWDAQTEASGLVSSGSHSNYVLGVANSPNNRQIASASADCTVRLWDARTCACGPTLSGHANPVRSVAYSPSGHQIASASYDKTIRLWDAGTGTCDAIWDLKVHQNSAMVVAYSPDGLHITSGMADGILRVWNVKTGVCELTMSGHTIVVTSVAYSPTGNQLVSASQDRTVRLWDPKTGVSGPILSGHKDAVRSAVYSPSGLEIASGSEDCTLRLWDAQTGACTRKLSGHTKRVMGVAYSASGDLLASASEDLTIRIWDAVSGDCLSIVDDVESPASSIVWNEGREGCFVVTGGGDGSVRSWKVTEADGKIFVRLYWRSPSAALFVKGAKIEGAKGLNKINANLLLQRGVVGEPVPPPSMKSASEKLVSMHSTLSRLRILTKQGGSDTPVLQPVQLLEE
ncbi:hypothetical protein EC968_006410 [Mortierella alpina]|nr:hypothetical protein EC968_006410 [Mortierella alpina]